VNPHNTCAQALWAAAPRTEARSYLSCQVKRERERDSGPNSTYLGHKGLESTSILRAQVGLGSRPGAVVLRARGRARPGARAVVAGPDSCFLGSFHAYIATYVSCHTYLRLALRTCSASPQIRNPPPPGAPRSGVPLGGTKKRSVSHGFEKTSPGSLLCQGVTLSDPRAHGTADTRPPSPFVYRL
jgi:hypothetical protein